MEFLLGFIGNKLGNYIFNKTVNRIEEIIKDWKSSTKEEAFKRILSIAFFSLFLEALKEVLEDEDIGKIKLDETNNILTYSETEELINLNNLQIDLENFNFKSFNSNDVINNIWEFYKEILLSNERIKEFHGVNKVNEIKEKREIISEKQNDIFRYISQHIESYFYQILDFKESDKDEGVQNLKDWIENESKYSAIYKYNYYLNKIAKEFEEPIFNNKDGILLKDIYIEQKFRIYEKCLIFENEKVKENFSLENPPRCENEDNENRGNFYLYTKENLKLPKFLYSLLNQNVELPITPENPQIILILGYPGEGKTSLTKKIVYDYVNNKANLKQTLYYIRLGDISEQKDGDFINKTLNTLKAHIKRRFKININDKELGNSIFLLDGLDEFIISTSITTEKIFTIFKNFYDIVKDEDNSKFIITSRYIQSEILDKLVRRNNLIVLELREFEENQIKEYLNKYQNVLEAKSKQFNIEKLEALKNRLLEILKDPDNKFCHIRELINQPIILYLLIYYCLSNEEKECHILFDENLTRAKFYGFIFEKIIERAWADETSPKIDKILYGNFLRELAHLLEFKKGSLVAEKDEITKLQSFGELKEEYENLDDEDIFKDILVGFYLREDDYKVEFLHKSFQEYLTAEYFYYKMLELPEKSDEEAEKIIWDVFSHRKMTEEIRGYLTELVKNKREEDREKQDKFLEKLQEIFPSLLKKDFIVKPEELTGKQPLNKPLFTFGNLWIIASLISNIQLEELANKIRLEKNNSKKYFIDFIIREHQFLNEVWKENIEYKNLFTRLVKLVQNCSETYLSNLNVQGLNLRKANFNKANLSSAKLNKCDLSKIDLSESNLYLAKLKYANLEKSNLSHSFLNSSDLQFANLYKADLSYSYLNSTNLFKANLRKASLDLAILINVNMLKVNLTKASLMNATLINVLLLESNLEGTNLIKADLTKSKLSGSNLKEAKLNFAKIELVDLSGADLTNSDLSFANLSGSNLKEANLSEADLSGAIFDIEQIKQAKNWDKAIYDEKTKKKLGLD